MKKNKKNKVSASIGLTRPNVTRENLDKFYRDNNVHIATKEDIKKEYDKWSRRFNHENKSPIKRTGSKK